MHTACSFWQFIKMPPFLLCKSQLAIQNITVFCLHSATERTKGLIIVRTSDFSKCKMLVGPLDQNQPQTDELRLDSFWIILKQSDGFLRIVLGIFFKFCPDLFKEWQSFLNSPLPFTFLILLSVRPDQAKFPFRLGWLFACRKPYVFGIIVFLLAFFYYRIVIFKVFEFVPPSSYLSLPPESLADV